MQFKEHCSLLFSYNFSIHLCIYTNQPTKLNRMSTKKHALLSINMARAEHNMAFKIYFIA